MTKADKIFKQIENKQKSIDKAKRYIALNPLSEINSELRETTSRINDDIIELEIELNKLYEATL